MRVLASRTALLASLCLSLALLALATPARADEPILGDKKMRDANQAASTVVKERLANERPADAAVLAKVEQADIVVVRGQYDRVEDVLSALGIPHTVVDPGQVGDLPLNARQLLIINCAGDLGAKGLERVRRFVKAGGYLYTTDWALTRVVQQAFPGFIAHNGVSTQNDVVEVEVRQVENNLLKHLTLSRNNPRWWLESSSYPIKVLDKKNVDVLIGSKEMKAKYGESAIAVHFRYGDGQVLHIASHFYLQQNETRTVAEKKSAKEFLDKDSALAPATKAALGKAAAVGGVSAGDLGSAYAAQQMTSNLVIERKKDQKRIDGLYNRRMAVTVSPGKGRAGVSTGAAVKELARKGDEVQVRTLEGEELWVPASSLRAP